MRSGLSAPSLMKTAQAHPSQVFRRGVKRPGQHDKLEHDADSDQDHEKGETLEADAVDGHGTDSLSVGLLCACFVAQNRAEECDDDHSPCVACRRSKFAGGARFLSFDELQTPHQQR